MQYLVATATLNEVDTIEELVQGVREHLPEADILVVDDNSNDGTQEKLSELGVKIISRPCRLGIGSAHQLAMSYASAKGYDALITMDADLSHNPKDIPRLLGEDADFVIGSRFIEGGKCNYPASRLVISKFANFLVRAVLRVPLHETTTSFRVFRKPLLEKLLTTDLQRNGYSFFFVTTYFVKRLRASMKEVPIFFEDRRAGSSKIKKIDILRSVIRLFLLRFQSFNTFIRTENSPCITCGSSFLTTVYPARKADSTEVDISCTGTVHGSHGPIKDCLECGLRQINPPTENVEAMYEEVEDQTYVENIGAREATFKYNWNKIKNLLPDTGKLLDVGAYCGVWAAIAKSEGYEAFGVEPSKWAVSYAKQHYGLEVYCGSTEQAPGQFDIITSWDVLEHVTNPNEFLETIQSKLNPGGYFCFSTVMVDSLFARVLGKRWPWYVDMHLTYYTQKTLKHLLENAGFEVKYQGHYTHVVKLSYLMSKLHKLRLAPKGLFSSSEKFVPICMRDVCLWVCRVKST